MVNQEFDFVNSFINNVSFPQTLEQFLSVIDDKGCYDIEHLIWESEEENGCLLQIRKAVLKAFCSISRSTSASVSFSSKPH